jgi:hypothetical protein
MMMVTMMTQNSKKKRMFSSSVPAPVVCILVAIIITQILMTPVHAQWALHSYLGGAVATSIAYDHDRDEIFSTGAAYANQFGVFEDGGPRCLMATFENGRLGRYRRDAFRVSHRRALEDLQVCTSAIVLDDPGDALLIGYHPANQPGETVQVIEEKIVEVDYYGETLKPNNVTKVFDAPGAPAVQNIRVPVHAVHDPQSDDVMVGVMETEALPESIEFQSATDILSFILNIQDSMSGGVHPWALNENADHDIWLPVVQRLTKKGDVKWSTDLKENGYKSHISRLAMDGNYVWVSGYRKKTNNDPTPADDADDHWDGMIYKLDLQSGAVLSANLVTSEEGQSHNEQIKCLTVQDNFIFAVGSTDNGVIQNTQDHASFGTGENFNFGDFNFGGEVQSVPTPAPTVGSNNNPGGGGGSPTTPGPTTTSPTPAPFNDDRARQLQGSGGGAFIMKIDKVTMRTQWVEHITGNGIDGQVCGSTDDAVYLGGSVPSAIRLSSEDLKVYGGMDAYLAQYKISDGSRNWMHRFGTELDEYLVDMLVDKTGAPIVGGNQQNRTGGRNDVFYFSFVKETGVHLPEWEQPETPNAAPQVTTTPKNNHGNRLRDNQAAVIGFAVAVPVFLIIVVAIYAWHNQQHPSGIDNNKNEDNPVAVEEQAHASDLDAAAAAT